MSAKESVAPTVDAELVKSEAGRSEALPLATRPGDKAPILAAGQPRSAAQAKIDAVASLTTATYERASQLKLTDEEADALQADFPDDVFQAGASGKEDLIYIQHSALRQRLNQVIGIGQWAIIPRSRWAEDYEYFDKNSRTHEKASRVYVEAMLLIRGCFVAEAVGDMSYYPKNAATNYGDAVEGAKTAALRRCTKELGIGLQAWDKTWCAGWWQRHRAARRAQPPPQAVPAQAPEKQFVEGIIEEISVKTGVKQDKTPWTKWGIKIRGEWYATFSATLHELAEANLKKPVRLEYSQTDKGRNAISITAEGITP